MNYQVTKDKVLTSLIWKFMERGGTQIVQIIVTITLARLLLPEEFGLIALISIFISIASIFVQSGFTTSLIQKKVVDELDFSSIFIFSLFVATILYFLIFFTAPLLSIFFSQQSLTPIIRTLSITLFLCAVNSVLNAVIARKMQYKKLFLGSLIANSISGVIGIILAFNHFGVWALVWQQLSNQITITIFLWISLKWRLHFKFSFTKIISHLSFGWKLLVSTLLDTLYYNLIGVLITKIFSPTLLGYYNKGALFPEIIINNLNGSIQSIMLPTLASFQDDKLRMKTIVRRAIVTSSFIIFPMMVGLAVIAESLVELILTEKWLPAVPFLQIFCAICALKPIHTANLQLINAIGRSDIILKLEVIKSIIGIIIIALTIPYGVQSLVLGNFVNGVIFCFIYAFPNIKFVNYSLFEQLKDVLPSFVLSIIMGFIVYQIKWFEFPLILTLVIQIFCGAILYIGMSVIFKLECFTYILSTIKEMFKNKSLLMK
ncbi:lipopolysaccharide biosynthesis protein [Lysinibacillus sp. BW-2-10]|uniref:lipopolysaccharide biosynthesis protein n=1 Tax=Lysinibacillus sp. BW-2-10 TaxID=2590030 RepID=UPI001180EFC0|nr:lipopolysaccharide biosynthesis protein [Lysinibacillus sp. BW-2-10]TSI11327.1 lipopolysaccharide biosynthesis protein [Lysinibacillus sp. BW-2-10]